MIDRKKESESRKQKLKNSLKKWQIEYKLLETRAVKHNSVSEKRCKI